MPFTTDHGKEAWSHDEQVALEIITLIGSCVSMFAMLISIILWLWKRKIPTATRLRDSWSTLVLLKFVPLLGLAFMVSLGSGIKSDGFCKAQGALVQLFAAANGMNSLFCGVQMAVIMAKKIDLLKEYGGLFLILPIMWVIPLIFMIVVLSIDAVGPSGLWCWIDNQHQTLRLVFLYIFPIGLAITVSEAGTVVASVIAKRAEKKGKKLAPKQKAALYYRPFLTAFVISWVLGTIIRVQTFIAPEDPVYALFVIHAIVTPIEGLFMSILFYIFNVRYRAKEDPSSEVMDEPMI